MKLMTCGSVDDGKSTLIGRLLFDTEGGITADQRLTLGNQETQDLASLTDGLEAEKAQGITIDIAYRFFSTAKRKFVIADCPGHEQYTRNMITAASTMDAALILVDVTKLDLNQSAIELLVQTKRHALLTHLMRVPNLIFVVNKLDAVINSRAVFDKVSQSIAALAANLQFNVAHIVPVSALVGTNVVKPGYQSWGIAHSLLDVLHAIQLGDSSQVPSDDAALLSVQYVELIKPDIQIAGASRRILWTQLMQGSVSIGNTLTGANGMTSKVAGLFNTTRQAIIQMTHHEATNTASTTVGVVLDQERDLSRGEWLGSQQPNHSDEPFRATLTWLDIEAAQPGRQYWLRHAHRWTKAKLISIEQVLDIQSNKHASANELKVNDIAQVVLAPETSVPVLPYLRNKHLGSMVLVDTASHRTVGAVLVQ